MCLHGYLMYFYCCFVSFCSHFVYLHGYFVSLWSSVYLCGCANGVAEMTFIDDTMNICRYTKILADKMTPSLQKFGRRGVFQHNNDPKHTAKITQEFLKKKKIGNFDLSRYVA